MLRLALICLSLSTAALASLSFTSPVASTVCIGNRTCTLSWLDDNASPDLDDWESARMGIFVGSALQQTLVQDLGIVTNPARTLTLNVTIDPASGPNGEFYFIRAESTEAIDERTDNFVAAFSARFKLDGMTGRLPANVNASVPIASVSNVVPVNNAPAPPRSASAIGLPRANGTPTTASLPPFTTPISSIRPTSSISTDAAVSLSPFLPFLALVALTPLLL